MFYLALIKLFGSLCRSEMNPISRKTRGRPRATAAVAHEAIIDATYELLHEKSVRELSIEEIATRAGVSKPTIYKWWPSKAALVIAMFDARVFEPLPVPVPDSAEATIRAQVANLVRQLDGFFGRMTSQIVAEGQSDAGLLREHLERYKERRLTFSFELIEGALARGEFKRHIEPNLLVDMIYGPIYYRFLFQHQPVTHEFGQSLVDQIMVLLKT